MAGSRSCFSSRSSCGGSTTKRSLMRVLRRQGRGHRGHRSPPRAAWSWRHPGCRPASAGSACAGSPGEQAVAVDPVEQRHRLAPERRQHVPVVDDPPAPLSQGPAAERLARPDLLQRLRGGGSDVLDRARALRIRLRAADRDAGGPVAPELHVGPGERGGLGAPQQCIPHDGTERDVDQPPAERPASGLGAPGRYTAGLARDSAPSNPGIPALRQSFAGEGVAPLPSVAPHPDG